MSSDSVIVPYVIPFNSCSLLLIEHRNMPFVPLEPVLQGVGLDWKNSVVQRSLKRFKATQVKIPILYKGTTKAVECLPLSKLPAWLMTIELASLDAKTRKQLVSYQNGCDDALWDRWLQLRESMAPAVNLSYEGRRFRFRWIGNECWYVVSDVVLALGLRDAASMLAALPDHMQLIQQIGGRRLTTINQAGLERTYLSAPPQCTERLRAWLASVNNDPQLQTFPGVSAEAFIRKESAQMTLDYLSRTKAAMRAAGVQPAEWDEARAQNIAENLPWLLIKDQRWLFTFSSSGSPQFSAVPSNAGVFTPEKVVSWVRESDGADLRLIPKLLHAIADRISTK